jgi:Bacterial transcriptional activator domain
MRPLPTRFDDAWPCLDFDTNGTARFKLRHQTGGPARIKVNADGSAPIITVRIDDIHRGFVPRRFRIPLWTRVELKRADPSPVDSSTAQRVLIEAHAAEDNCGEARRSFESYRRLIRHELGVDPSRDLTAFVDQGAQLLTPVVTRTG